MPIAEATDPTMKYFAPASPPVPSSLWKATRTYVDRDASSIQTMSMNKFVAIVIMVIPRPTIIRRM